MEIFFAFVFAVIALVVILAFAKVVFTFILEIIGPAILPFLVVRFITWGMEHWMGSTIAWILSIAAGIVWGVYPKLKQLFTDTPGFLQEMREREEKIAREKAEFDRMYRAQCEKKTDDYNKEEVERCDADKYE